MILRHQSDWKSKLPTELADFFNCIFTQFEKELNQIAQAFYPQEKEDTVFECIERQWVGIFNNAVIKSTEKENVSTIQEYSVPLAPKQYGRADYLVRWKNIDFLFEAKMYEERGGQWTNERMEEDYQKVLDQARKYLKYKERGYYEKELYLVALYFGWMREKDFVVNAKAYMDKEKVLGDTTDFCSLFCNENAGVWVYGRVEKCENENLKKIITP